MMLNLNQIIADSDNAYYKNRIIKHQIQLKLKINMYVTIPK